MLESRNPFREAAPLPTQMREPSLETTSTANIAERATEISGSISEEDDVELPGFVDDCAVEFHKNNAESINRVMDNDDDDELISDADDDRICAQFSSINSRVEGVGFGDRLSVGVEKERDRNDVWDEFFRDADEIIVNGDENTRRDSKRNRSCRSRRGKSKSKAKGSCYSFRYTRPVDRSVSKEEVGDPFESSFLDGLEDNDCRNVDPLGADDEIGEADDDGSLVDRVCEHGVAGNSMAELLDELQGKEESENVLTGAKPRAKPSSGKKGRRRQVPKNRSGLSIGTRSVDGEDSFDDWHSGSGSGDEGDVRNINAVTMERMHRSVADQFEEALGAEEGATSAVLRQSSAGLFGRLQSVMQGVKEHDLEFSRMLHSKAGPRNEGSCIVVKILSRSLEARLTVCCCSIWHKNRQWEERYQEVGLQKTGTVIFSSRICSNIDLEVGKLIRIHAPWKEVEVLTGGDRMILATYFSYV